MSVIVMAPEAGPSVAGLKVTVMVQFAPTARLVPQVSLSANPLLAAIALMPSATLPVLVRVAVCGRLGIPISGSQSVRS